MPVLKSWSCVHFVCWGYTSLCGMEQTRKTKHAWCLACRVSHNWPSSLTTSITTWVSHYHPWPLLLQRESHTIIPDHFCYHVSLTFHITDCHTWPLLLQCESHTIIPDHFCYNVSLTLSSLTTSITTWVSHYHPWPLLLSCESHISHNWLSHLTASITMWVSHFT